MRGLQKLACSYNVGKVDRHNCWCAINLLGFLTFENGEVSEWFKEHAWKACVGETQPWVRIPPSPPYHCLPLKTVLFIWCY